MTARKALYEHLSICRNLVRQLLRSLTQIDFYPLDDLKCLDVSKNEKEGREKVRDAERGKSTYLEIVVRRRSLRLWPTPWVVLAIRHHCLHCASCVVAIATWPYGSDELLFFPFSPNSLLFPFPDSGSPEANDWIQSNQCVVIDSTCEERMNVGEVEGGSNAA